MWISVYSVCVCVRFICVRLRCSFASLKESLSIPPSVSQSIHQSESPPVTCCCDIGSLSKPRKYFVSVTNYVGSKVLYILWLHRLSETYFNEKILLTIKNTIQVQVIFFHLFLPVNLSVCVSVTLSVYLFWLHVHCSLFKLQALS